MGIPVWVEEEEVFSEDVACGGVASADGSDKAVGAELGDGSGDAIAADVELSLEFGFAGDPAYGSGSEEAVEGFGVC